MIRAWPIRIRGVLCAFAAASLLCVAAPLEAAVTLVPVLRDLAAPTYAGHAGDGSNRLFVVEQAGVVRVLQPGASSATTFIDIQPKVLAGGERGLLGLAFHPDYAANRRFFVYYTRAADGAIVVAEHKTSANPDVADDAEKMLLVIPHPTYANHNGGMLAFGHDRMLYIGVGDGGASNDPPDNAQNLEVLLGKILRIDVDRADPAAGTPYAIPADNPFVGRSGRDEIYAYGLRNPWRFSFDLVTGVQWLADVGQGTREEVNMPIQRGGNYGWRVFEGFGCTGNDPTLCDPARYRPPVFDYAHDEGRCSIIGGYVYRGSQAALPGGTYVFGDFCSGEVFAWDGTARRLLLATGQNITSFGEDEQGELYVVALGGTVSRIATVPTCDYTVTPAAATFPRDGGAASFAVSVAPGCAWLATSNVPWITLTSGATGNGDGIVTYVVARYDGSAKKRSGTIAVAGSAVTITQTKERPLVTRPAPPAKEAFTR
jgi:glucose/arabinose dehydrogenase